MKEKQNYISPQSEELELRLEGMIAASTTNFNFGSPGYGDGWSDQNY